MPLDRLLAEITAHYADRGFPQTALFQLRWTIQNSIINNDSLQLTGAYNLARPRASLLGHFQRCARPDATPLQIAACQAIFALSFGYRHKAGHPDSAEARLPGTNNRALAEIAAGLNRTFDLPIFAQFEVADALDDATNVSADFITPREDMNTKKALEYFLQHAKDGAAPKKVVVVAHRHHMERCLILLREDFGIEAIACPERYEGYDDRERQRRAMSAEEFIISDFVSMAARAVESSSSGE